ncbi:MAG: hypothetical protein OCC45_16400 [Desulfotalea sp.]
MRISKNISELNFIEEIDANFKFDSDNEYEEATRIACTISDNAVLMIGYELSSLSSYASLELNIKLLKIIKEQRKTPIVHAALPVIESLLKKEKVKKEMTQKLLNEYRKNNHVWNALCILECIDNSFEEQCEKIREECIKNS